MNNLNIIPEQEYKKIINMLPIFCVDFLIKAKGKYLLLKRKEEPQKDIYWVIGGRLRFKETISKMAERILDREIGVNLGEYKLELIGFSNYFFPKSTHSKATHTPTILYLIEMDHIFEPKIDSTHSHFTWSKKLPIELIKQTQFLKRA